MAHCGCVEEIQKIIDEAGDDISYMHLRLPERPEEERSTVDDWRVASGQADYWNLASEKCITYCAYACVEFATNGQLEECLDYCSCRNLAGDFPVEITGEAMDRSGGDCRIKCGAGCYRYPDISMIHDCLIGCGCRAQAQDRSKAIPIGHMESL